MAYGDRAAEQYEKDQPTVFDPEALTRPKRQVPLPSITVREQGERLQAAMDEVRRQTNRVGNELRELEIYAREKSGEVRGHYKSTEASRAYDDMADRIAALLGGGA